MEHLISVIIPVFNKEKRLANAIESVLKNKNECQIIIVDDGSTDMSGEIADKYAENYKNIRVIHQDNQWVYAAFNNGIKATSTEYFYILNADDQLYENSIDIMISLLKKHKYPDVIWTRCELFYGGDLDNNWKMIPMDAGNISETIMRTKNEVLNNWPYLFENRFVENQANLYRRELALKHQFRNDVYAADGLFNIQIANDIKSAIIMDKPVYKYYRYAAINENISNGKFYPYQHNLNNEIFNGHKQILEKLKTYNESKKVLCAWRLLEFMSELNILCSNECKYSLENKIDHILGEFYDEIILSSAKCLGREKEIEGRVLFFLRNLFLKETIDSNSRYYFAYQLIQGLNRFENDEKDIEIIEKAVNNPLNKNKLGNLFLNDLRVTNNEKDNDYARERIF